MREKAKNLLIEGNNTGELISSTKDEKAQVSLANEYVGKVDALWSASGMGRTTDAEIASTKVHPVTKVNRAMALLYILLQGGRSYAGGGVSVKDKDKTSALAVVEPKNYYERLGVGEKATQKEIELAYQKGLKNFQIDALEQQLRTRGLDESEIKARVERVRREYEDYQEAYAGIGHEYSRKQYDEFRKNEKAKDSQEKTGGGQQDQKRSSAKKPFSPDQRAYDYQTLGAGPNPTQIELRTEYRKRTKELHPDSFLAEVGKRREDLTPGELKELQQRESQLRDVNLAYARVRDQEQLNKEIAERVKHETPPPQPEARQNIVITATPTTTPDKAAVKKTEKFRTTVSTAGEVSITPEELVQLKTAGVQPENITLDQASKNATIALNANARGFDANQVSAAVDKSGLPQNIQDTLQQVVFDMEAVEVRFPKQSLALKQAAGNLSNVTIQEVPPSFSPSPNSITLQNQGGGGLEIIKEEILGKGMDVLKEKGEEVIAGAIEKGGVTAAKSAANKVAVEALSEGGKKLVTQLGSKIALKLGLSAAGAAVSAGTSLIIQAVLEVGKKLLSAAKKFVSGILRLITGQEDIRSQLKQLAIYGFVLSLAMGSIAGAAVSGGSFVLLSGTGSIGATISGIFGAFVYAMGAIVVVISGPIIAAFFITIFLIIFIIMIINNSAFVVPYGGWPSERSTPPPPGSGNVALCTETAETGRDITNPLAARIQNGEVHLLPDTVWGRADGICITPTMIIMHWSAGTNDNPDGNLRTYETLVAGNLSCQLGTDTNDTWLMERFFEYQVEFPACAGEWNTYSINNEMAGVYFTDPPPPPNLDELELTYNATCEVMEQYNIPWCQIYGHFEVPNNGGKSDPGREFLYNVFIPEIRDRCPNDNGGACAGVTRP